jgi:hypothetical protein
VKIICAGCSYTRGDELSDNELSYPAYIAEKLSCEVINLGQSGNCQLNIIQQSIVEVSKYLNENVILLMQNTFPDRVWIQSIYSTHNICAIPASIENYFPGELTIAYEVKDVLLKYFPRNNIDHCLQVLAVKNFCRKHNIKFMTFCVSNVELPIQISEGLHVDLRLVRHFNGISYRLPKGHPNAEAHKVLGDWLIEEMSERKFI